MTTMVGFSKMIQKCREKHMSRKQKKKNMRELVKLSATSRLTCVGSIQYMFQICEQVCKVPHNPKIEHAWSTTSPGQKW